MICPKAGDGCDGCKTLHSNHSIPHKDWDSCHRTGNKSMQLSHNCPPCVPYREFQVGDRVEVLGKTTCNGGYEGISSYYGTSIGSVVKIKSFTINCCRNCGIKRLYNIEGKNGSVGVYHPQDLKHAEKGDEMEYKALTIPTWKRLLVSGDTKCGEFCEEYGKLLAFMKPNTLTQTIYFNDLITWAEQDPKRIKWLLEKGYIEKSKSDIDKWFDEIPEMVSASIGTVGKKVSIGPKGKDKLIEWAKRMPK